VVHISALRLAYSESEAVRKPFEICTTAFFTIECSESGTFPVFPATHEDGLTLIFTAGFAVAFALAFTFD
jgi:hypothetical protein